MLLNGLVMALGHCRLFNALLMKVLRPLCPTYPEYFGGFRLTTFNGAHLTI
jgi:hypothetical protein